MISRRRFTTGVVIALTPLGATASAQEYKAQQPQVRIGVLATVGSGAQELEHALRELGWVDGRNVIIERRLAPSYDGLARHARELAQLPVDVMVCTNAPAVRAAKSATQTIPIVMATGWRPDRCRVRLKPRAPGWDHHRRRHHAHGT